MKHSTIVAEWIKLTEPLAGNRLILLYQNVRLVLNPRMMHLIHLQI